MFCPFDVFEELCIYRDELLCISRFYERFFEMCYSLFSTSAAAAEQKSDAKRHHHFFHGVTQLVAVAQPRAAPLFCIHPK